MSGTAHKQATLVFERLIPAPVNAVFDAFADVAKRVAWGAPSTTAALIYDASDFREGGLDRFRCGSKSDPRFHGVTQYLRLVPNHCIVSSETIDCDGKRLSASLTNLELSSEGDETRLVSTTHVVSFVDDEMVKGTEVGNNASLDNLMRYFADRRATKAG